MREAELTVENKMEQMFAVLKGRVDEKA